MATRFGKLPLNDAPRTLVFRVIDSIIRSDRNLQRVLSRDGAILSWRGSPGDKNEFAKSQAPAIRLTPVPDPETWWYPGSTKGDLVVLIEMLVDGLAIDDVENLFWAIQRALAPAGQTEALAIHNRLTAAGAITGEILWQPAKVEPQDTGCCGQFIAFGMAKLEVKAS